MLNAPCLEGVGTYRRGLLDSFDTHAAKSPKKRLVSQSKEQEAKLEGEEGRNVQWRILHTCFIILCTSTKLTPS